MRCVTPDNGARVVNASVFITKFLPVLSTGTTRTAEYLRSRGVLLVHAAGNAENNNDLINNVNYDGLENVIEVAASDRGDNLASFSSYGGQLVHVAAPGGSLVPYLLAVTVGSLEPLWPHPTWREQLPFCCPKLHS